MRTRTALIAAVIAALALGAAPARAAPYETMIQDDNVLVYGSDSDVSTGMGLLRNLGVDRARITLPWSLAAPRPKDRRKPRGFRADQPDAYAPSARTYRSTFIYRIDRAVLVGALNGVKIDLDIGFGAPRWAAAGFGSKDRFGAVNRPSPAEFARFARAMARRYSGRFAPVHGKVVLPRVDVFELWNEPNVPTFLQPQWQGGVAAAADQYRAMVQAAYPAVKAVNRGAKVLIGVTAPGGGTRGGAISPIAPIPFLRRLACVDARLHPVRDGGCRHFRRVPGDGLSHHPYALKSPPGVPTSDPNIVRVANLDRITQLSARLVSRHRFAPGTRDLWLTEFGYETNDPVRTKPWTLDQQTRLLAQAEYLSQRNPRVRAITQFLLRDVLTAPAVRLANRGSRARYPGSWQTGLYYEDFRPKPSASTFPLTLLPFRDGSSVGIFGHVRPDRNGGLAIRIEGLKPDGTWEPIDTSNASGGDNHPGFVTQPGGVFLRRFQSSAPPALYRYGVQLPNGSWFYTLPQPLQDLDRAPPP
ncbi:MAG: hypothetical protein QOH11_2440 [Solirubrobacteraceae bacterium]|jgi:hypothetical protein|nr:hypothetical protein [Solirubrobacteraceae bacterium]